jgi:hypothetical protein
MSACVRWLVRPWGGGLTCVRSVVLYIFEGGVEIYIYQGQPL